MLLALTSRQLEKRFRLTVHDDPGAIGINKRENFHVMLTSSLAYRATTITVSGYPPLAAILATFDGRRIVASTTPIDLGPPLPAKRRCAGPRCLSWGPPTSILDDRLGWTGWCAPCVARGVVRCRRRHGRLPGPGEFWCPACGRILDRMFQARVEADGRRRLRCKTCRQAQYLARDARRRSRTTH